MLAEQIALALFGGPALKWSLGTECYKLINRDIYPLNLGSWLGNMAHRGREHTSVMLCVAKYTGRAVELALAMPP